MSDEEASLLAGSVEIQPHGISGVEGAPYGAIRRETDPRGFADAFWLAEPSREDDVHAGFLGRFLVEESGTYTFSIQASGNFRAYLDGTLVISGPLRFSPSFPEFHRQELPIGAGEHVLAIRAHGELLMTRTTAPLPNFVWCHISTEGTDVPITWRGRELTEFRATGLRVSPLLGWVEWQDSPWSQDWKRESTDHTRWSEPRPLTGLDRVMGTTVTPAELSLRAWPRLPLHPQSQGLYRDTYVGYEMDDLAVQFLLADPHVGASDDPDGIWMRFDLDRIRIGSIEFSITTSLPAEVTVAYADRLTPSGRPSPVVALSTGPTRMIQRFAIDAGHSRIEPMQSLGGRYIELRIATRGTVEVTDVEFVERDLLGTNVGTFESDDPLLNEIWITGINTLRSSAEDALVDSVRERGEWVGDVVSSALNLLEVGWGDYRLIRRALLHSAAGARSDGLVAGCGPGEILYLGTYAAQWSTACVELAIAEGSVSILLELEESGRANISALRDSIRDDGTHTLPWGFVDWGYGVPRHQPDLGVLLHVLRAEQSWARWLELIGKDEEAKSWGPEVDRLSSICRQWLDRSANSYHSSTLAAAVGLADNSVVAGAILEHIRSSFPFDRGARRLRSPVDVDAGVTTPYFTNYSVKVLLDSGLGHQVADIWRSNWGWMLEQGATTWYEVFDERWSQCHYWSGAPTWQMSRYGLGLHRALDTHGPNVKLLVNTLGLEQLSGSTYLPGSGLVSVSWTKTGDTNLDYSITTNAGMRIDVAGQIRNIEAGSYTFELTRRPNTEFYE